MYRSIVVLVGGLASLATVSLFAQDAVLGQEYGAGVHAFFAGDYTGAYEHLTAAIQGGSKDPRAFYFRGLSCLNLGRAPDAAIDFRKGAELESSDVNRFYDVGKALERVQGLVRVELEKYRVTARMAALEAAEKIRKQRYEAIQREESRVVREQAQGAPPPGEEIQTPPAAEEEGEENPFDSGQPAKPVKKAGKAAKKPAKAAPADESEDNPFAAEPAEEKPEKKATSEKPAEKEKKSAEKKKAAGDEDPFSEPESSDKPADKPKKPADNKKPAAEKKPTDEKKPAAEKKPADDKKPAAEKKPADDKKPAAEKKPADEKKPAAGKKPDDKKPDPAADPFAP